MKRHVSRFFFALTILGGVGAAAWLVNGWADLKPGDLTPDQLKSRVLDQLPYAFAPLAAALLGWLTSFSPRLSRRPVLLICAGFAFAGVAIGSLGREGLSAWEFISRSEVQLDVFYLASTLSIAIILPALIMAFEAVNRWIWSSLAESFDAKGMPGAALAASRVQLLFAPGHGATLRSVALARFRQGARGDVIETLTSFYDQGQRDGDLLEALAKAAREAGNRELYLRHLRELCELFPEDETIHGIFLDELLAQEQFREALVLMERAGMPTQEDAMERHAEVLLALGELDRAVAVAARLGEKEGIPFRRSHTLLREVLSRASEKVDALNTLAAQAERMAMRDQRVRWLEKSLEADPRQTDVREQLVQIYRETGNSRRLEQLLEATINQSYRSDELAYEFAAVLYQNEKHDDALIRLEPLVQRPTPFPKAVLLEARIHFDNQRWESARKSVMKARTAPLDERHSREVETLAVEIDKAVLTEDVQKAVAAAEQLTDSSEAQLTALRLLIDGLHVEKTMRLADQALTRHPSLRDEVILHLQNAVQRPNAPFPFLNLLSDLLVARARYDDALEVVRQMASRAMDRAVAVRDGSQKILRRSPHHLPTLRLLGDTYLESGRFTDMIHSYSLYLANGGEENDQINHALAKAYLSLGDYENARRFVNQLLATEPDSVELLTNVIPLAVASDKPEDAAEYMKRLELLRPRDPETKRLKEQVNAGLGERRLAYLKREMEAGKADSSTLEQLGDLARDVGNFNDAITYYQRASRDRENPLLARRANAKLALSYLRKRLDDLASETLRDLTISLDDDPEELAKLMDILYETGELFLEMKLYAKAERIFKQLCKIDAGYRDVLKKVENLRA